MYISTYPSGSHGKRNIPLARIDVHIIYGRQAHSEEREIVSKKCRGAVQRAVISRDMGTFGVVVR